MDSTIYVHPTAIVEVGATIGVHSKVWHFCHIREEAVLGTHVITGKGVYIDKGVRIGNHTKIQNGVSVYSGVHLAPWCFVGPHVVFTNDLSPRAGNRSWTVIDTRLGMGASVGAGAIIRCGISIGDFAMIGAGAIVCHDVNPFELCVGFPGRAVGKLCVCGTSRLSLDATPEDLVRPCCVANCDPEFLAEAVRFIEVEL